MKSVAIIGGGIAGILSLRHTLQSNVLRPVLFEATGKIGGVWAYDDETAVGLEYNVNDAISIYKNLVTNQSKQIMEFPDFRHSVEVPTYLPHEMVMNYLDGYVTQYGLRNWIKCRHRVQLVSPVFSGSKDVRWKLDVVDLNKNEEFSEIFDSVIVCVGHFSKPNIPDFQGMSNFKGKLIHSRSYRYPSQFTGEDVLLVGAAASGVDISLDVATAARKVYLSNRGRPINSEMPENFVEVPEIRQFDKDGASVTFVNGEAVQVSSVIFCTGYRYHFPFLDESCGISINDNRVTSLFKHIVNIKHNSMLFVGLPHRIPVFPVLTQQAIYVARVLTDQVSLPCEDDMYADEAADFDARMQLGWPQSKAHLMTGRVFEYADYLADASGADRIPSNIKNLYNFVLHHRERNIMTYKAERYILDENNEYIVEDSDRKILIQLR